LKGEVNLAQKLMKRYPGKYESLDEARKEARKLLRTLRDAKQHVLTGIAFATILATFQWIMVNQAMNDEEL
jgi:hypothetical protein